MDAILFWFAIGMAVISLCVLLVVRIIDIIKWLWSIYATDSSI